MTTATATKRPLPFQPAELPTAPGNLTLFEIFNQVYLPARPDLAKATREHNRRQMYRWVDLMGNLPAAEVTRETLLDFRNKCAAQHLHRATVIGHLRIMIKMLRTAGVDIKESDVSPRLDWSGSELTLDEFNRVWMLVDQAQWPSSKATDYRALPIDVYPGAWWRALLMLAYTTGLRRRELFSLKWNQVERLAIRVTFPTGARPKLLPITEPLRPWLRMLAKNETETVLGHADHNELDYEFAHLREISAVPSLSLNGIRYLAIREWERAGKGCGPLIRNHKSGTKVSDFNYRRLDHASDSLAYPPNVRSASTPLDAHHKFLDQTLADPLDLGLMTAKEKQRAMVPPEAPSSLNTFNNFFVTNKSSSLKAMTLREVFEASLLTIVETDGVTKSTISGYRLALSHWERLTDNPPIRAITTEYLQQFRKRAKAETLYSPASLNNWFRVLRSILNHLGPRTNASRRSRSALAFYSEVPWLDSLPEPEASPVHLTDDQLSKIYERCDVAEWPPRSRTGSDPADWWRAALVIMTNYGQRLRDWYLLPTNAICFETDSLTFVAKKTGKKQALVLNDTVTWHLRKLDLPGREFVFTPSHTLLQLYRDWHRIQTAAGVADPDGNHFTFHAIRATAAARYHEHFPGTAELLLGHALKRENRVTAKHYLGQALLKPLWHAIRNIPQPAAFTRAMPANTSALG